MSAVAAAVVAALLVFTGARAQRSAEFCTPTCHVAAGGAHLPTPGHASVSCQSCHAISPGVGIRLAVTRALGGKSAKPHGKATAATCASCHNSSDAAWDRIAATAGHRKHPAAEKLDCLSCHAKTLHAKKASAAETCSECHDDARLHAKDKLDEGPKPQCLGCHNFSVPRKGGVDHVALTTDACARCHSEAAKKGAGVVSASLPPSLADVVPASVIDRAGLHGGVDCKLCHQPHDHATGKGPKRACKSCHQIQIVSSNPNLPKEHLLCESCHEQHKPVSAAGSRCVKCHEQARPKGDVTSTALRHEQCASCHMPHTWAAAPNECVTCHGKQATLVQTQSPDKHQRCTNCHEVHGKPPTGATCGTCHKENAKKMLAAPAKHQNCISCHNPHAPQVKVPATCSECHKAPLHQLVTLGPAAHAKASCQSCHTIHGNPKADTKKCAECHKDKGTAVAAASKLEHRTCTSCHLPHRFAIDQASPPCAKCHVEIGNIVATGKGSHGGKCVNCHAPHGQPTVAREKCLGCHVKVQLKAPNPDHNKCASCHKPHIQAASAIARCGACHADKAKLAALWPAGSAHREKCNECHKPHDVRDKAACGNCHQKQQMAAMGGKHECKSCHAVHQAPPPDKKGWWGRCVNCHADKVKATSASKHSKCDSCHQPHKFGKPDCKSCHEKQATAGLHTSKSHQACTKCHDTHSASKPSRADCLSTCHSNLANHQPDAKICTGCHVFKLQ
ncbi:MAG: cytochrome c3 family protein [Deltaproteobacteria bacterium]|nr:cytochrome c3 family protein [Deltaproteobacteria bacterium]